MKFRLVLNVSKIFKTLSRYKGKSKVLHIAKQRMRPFSSRYQLIFLMTVVVKIKEAIVNFTIFHTVMIVRNEQITE